jgi:hypothetical protein
MIVILAGKFIAAINLTKYSFESEFLSLFFSLFRLRV